MKFFRTLFAACAVLLLSAAPAAAQVDYPPTSVSPTSLVRSTTVPPFVTPGQEVTTAGAGGPLARTGSNNIVPLVQAALVLLGGGMLLVLVARRRHVVRRSAA